MPQLRRKVDRQDESSTLPLFDGPSKPEQHEVSAEFIVSRPTLLHAMNFAQEVSGLEDKQVAGELGIDLGQWSRIKSGNAHFPTNKYPAFMRMTGNVIPLQWLANAMGYEVKPLLNDLERQLAQERAVRVEAERENKLMRELLQGRK